MTADRAPSEVLFAPIPAWGHVNPLLGGMAELTRRGHKVSCLATSDFADRVSEVAEPVSYSSPMRARGASSATSDVTDVMPLALAETEAAFGALRRHAATRPPDIVVHDVMGWAGWLLARERGLPTVCSWPVFASNEHFSLHRDYATIQDEGSAAMVDFFGAVAKFLDSVGLDSVAPTELFESEPTHHVVHFPREFQPRGETFDERFTFVPPSVRAPERSSDAVWLDAAEPLVVVSLGTIYHDNAEFFRTCVEAVARLGWPAAVALGGSVRREELGEVPEHVLLRERLPMIDALRNAAVLVGQGGMGSTLEALSYGVPLLLAPQMGEQRAVADRVEALGLGRRLDQPFTAAALERAIREIVQDAEVARRVAAFREQHLGHPGSRGVADAVEAHLPR
ncbi:MAG: macrolide family glycosyltransferase [Umezawaea sp.]